VTNESGAWELRRVVVRGPQVVAGLQKDARFHDDVPAAFARAFTEVPLALGA
jgi:hypothetical protein